MREPKVSILWLNYNSSSFIDIVLESLQGVEDLDYYNYEFIAVDNGSTDESYKIIRDFIEKMKNARIIRSDRNLGFTGGNNLAYRAKDPESKYVVLLNNDAIPYPESLKRMVEIMEINSYLGGCQGIILNYRNNLIDTAGDFMDELLGTHLFMSGEDFNSIKKPVYVTYVNGAYSIYRIKAVKRL